MHTESQKVDSEQDKRIRTFYSLNKKLKHSILHCQDFLHVKINNDAEKLQHQQRLCAEILKKLEVIDPMPIAAGGAPRNWFYEKPARDIDIYFKSFYDRPKDIQKQLIAIGINASLLGGKDYESYIDNKELKLKAVFQFNYFGQEFQLMCTKKRDASEFYDGHDHMLFISETFDCDSCKAYTYLSGNKMFFDYDQSFYKDHINNVLTFKSDYEKHSFLADHRKYQNRILKMKKYFPDRRVEFSEFG